jgi:hypothetical protein
MPQAGVSFSLNFRGKRGWESILASGSINLNMKGIEKMIKLSEREQDFQLWCNAIAHQYDEPLTVDQVGDILSVCFYVSAGEPCSTFAEDRERHRELAALINQEIERHYGQT